MGQPSTGVRLLVFFVVLCSVVLAFLLPSLVPEWCALVYRMGFILLGAVSLLMIGFAFHLHLLLNVRRTLLLCSAVLLQLVLMMGVNACKDFIPGFSFEGQLLLWQPYLLAPTILAVMVGRRLGAFAACCCSLFGLPLFPSNTPLHVVLTFGLISLVAGSACALISGRVHKREHVLRAGFICAGVVMLTVFPLMALRWMNEAAGTSPLLGTLVSGFHFGRFAAEAGVTVGVNFVLAALVGGMMPALERLFNISTPITWLEWADMNHPLLKKLQIAAPGTFHHSLVVQRLAEAAAEAIGADVTRAGVCGLYHDIGKIKNPQYFAENIVDQSNSPHADLTPEASARIITGHVQDGVELAQSYGLNRRIVNVIREHHGVSTAYFFFRKASDKYDEEKEKFESGLVDTCPAEVDKSLFSYKGPIPQSRESGIVSMADAVESATRSLQHPTEEDILSMINGIFKGRILDGHLQDSGLTLGDIEVMKSSFFTTIRTMHHNRIAYPKPKADDATVVLAEKRQAEK